MIGVCPIANWLGHAPHEIRKSSGRAPLQICRGMPHMTRACPIANWSGHFHMKLKGRRGMPQSHETKKQFSSEIGGHYSNLFGESLI